MLTLYVDMISQPSRAVLLFAKQCKLPVKSVLVKLGSAEQHRPEFKSVNPRKKVPFLIDEDGFKLSESHAIMRYLAESRKADDHWYPHDIKARARVEEHLDWHHTNLRQGAAKFVWGKTIGPRLGMPLPEDVVTTHSETLHMSMKFLDEHLASQKYVAGDAISIGDISSACEIAQLMLVPSYDWKAQFPHADAWFDRVGGELDGWDEVHKMLFKFAAIVREDKPTGKEGPASKL